MPRLPRDEKLITELARRVREAREAAGISQEAMAWYSGLSRTYVGSLERGLMSPSVDAIVRVAHALGVDPADLVRGLKPST